VLSGEYPGSACWPVQLPLGGLSSIKWSQRVNHQAESDTDSHTIGSEEARGCGRMLVRVSIQEARSWRVHDEQDLGAFGRGSLRRVSVDLPDGGSFDQYVILLPEAVVVAAVDTAGSVLMVRRHRFIIDRWVWEFPGGYVDDGEDLEAAAVRELEEETGWRPARVDHLVSFQPMVGSADSANHVYAAYGCNPTHGDVDINEAVEVRWFSLAEAGAMVRSGEIVGAASVVAISELTARAAVKQR
jgi:ADP-ribose pyrophosphatase